MMVKPMERSGTSPVNTGTRTNGASTSLEIGSENGGEEAGRILEAGAAGGVTVVIGSSTGSSTVGLLG